jgi:hypothetical protein
MTLSNFHDLEILLDPWIGGADDDEMNSRLAELDPNNENSMKELIRSDLQPLFKSLRPIQQRAIFQALQNVSVLSPSALERHWESLLPPFSLPFDSALLFVWIYEVIGPNKHEEVQKTDGE